MWLYCVVILIGISFFTDQVLSQSINPKPLGFKNNPTVKAECSSTNMFVYVDTSDPFSGIINARGHRDSCFQMGDGVSRRTVLIIPLLNTPTDPIYCAQQRDVLTGEYKVYIDVHAHKILELENDKTFLISCSQNGMLGDGNLHLSLLKDGDDLNKVVQDDQYVVRINYSNSTNPTQQLDVRNCLAFGRGNVTQTLSDNRGCPLENSPLGKFDSNATTAVAIMQKMLRFQDSSQVFLQCDVGLCRSPCPKLICPGEQGYDANSASQKLPRSEGGQGLAGSTFTVVEPGTAVPVAANQCGYGEWVLALCITFGILFLIMLIVNIIMCSAVSCNCTRKDQTEEVHQDPSAWGEYDTVKNVWSSSMSGGSIPGDRHSVHSGIPVHVNGGSQYAPRGPSPYYHPRGAVLHDDRERDAEMRDVRSSAYMNSVPPPSMSYGDHYSMAHRNGSATKYS